VGTTVECGGEPADLSDGADDAHHSRRLEAIGREAVGIGHDFNNLLLAVRGYAELALRRLDPDHGAAADIRGILTTSDHAAELTRQLLDFGRRPVLSPVLVDLGDVVRDMGELLQQLIGERIQLATSLPREAVLVEIDRCQLKRVLANLARNARDAMPKGGLLTIQVSAGAAAHLTVIDTGAGMDAETAARVFEPFFTTKGGAGSGLGLATVQAIARESGGRVTVESERGRGTTFRLELPLKSG
jgi:two-component system, cell cycle sensor histidine kinase and response regulator CckA